MTQTPPALLPTGLEDLLPPASEAEADAVTSLLSSFARFGYRRVKPPLAEYEESLLSHGSGRALADKAFRMMDPVSSRMMAVRADTTMQMARIAAVRLKDQPRPLRLSYTADVLRVRASQQRPRRQFTQAGCELIGSDHVRAGVELGLIGLKALKELGVTGISLDICAPCLAGHVISALDLDGDAREGVTEAIKRRESTAIKQICGEDSPLATLAACTGPAGDVLPILEGITLEGEAARSLERLIAMAKELGAALDAQGLGREALITLDPLESKGFEYQQSPAFTFFSARSRAELGRGGRYMARFPLTGDDVHEEDATGFTLYMDTLLALLPDRPAPARLFVPAGTAWEVVTDMEKKGWSLVLGLAETDGEAQALAQGCSHILEAGAVRELCS